MRLTLWLLPVAAAAAIIAVLWAGRSPRSPPAPPTDSTDVSPTNIDGSGGAPAPVPADTPLGRIRGTVYGDGVPGAARVEVRALWRPPEKPEPGFTKVFLRDFDPAAPPIAAASAGEDGRFEFTRLARGQYEISAQATDGASGWTSGRLDEKDLEAEVSIDLETGGHTLSGRVLYADGQPFRGRVGVACDRIHIAGIHRPVADTDDEGRFVLGGIRWDTVGMRALLPGRALYHGPEIDLPRGGPFEWAVDASHRDYSGRVIGEPGGIPLAGVRLEVHGGEPDDWFFGVTDTDADGCFAVSAPDWAECRIHAEGYPVTSAKLVRGDGEQVIRLYRFGSITGKVVTEAGAPVPGVTVMLDGNRSVDWREARATSGADGRFTIDRVAPGAVRIFARGAGHISRSHAGEKLDGAEVPPGGSTEAEIVVVPAARARGRLLDADGAPVGGVEAWVEEPRDLKALHPFTLRPVTDAEGRFRADGLAPDADYRFKARPPGHLTASAGPFRASAGETLEVELRVPAGRRLELTVVEEGSKAPVPRAEVRPFATGLHERGPFLTDREGRLALPHVPNGRIGLWVKAKGCLDATDEVPGGEDDAQHEVVLLRERRIEGRLLFPDGRPAANAFLRCRRAEGGHRWDVRVSTEGGFRLPVKPGEYELTATCESNGMRYRGTLRAKADTKDIEFTLEEIGRVFSIEVLGPDGTPVPRAKVHWWFPDGRSGLRLTGYVENGEVKVPESYEVLMGRLWVEVFLSTDAEGAALPWGAVLHGPIPESGGEVTIRLPREKRIEGRVIGSDGSGVTGVPVEAVPILPGMFKAGGKPPATAVTAEDGTFRLGGLGDFEYYLGVSPPEGYLKPDTVRAKAGARDIEVRVEGGCRVTVTVLSPGGDPIAGVHVRAWSRLGGSSADGTTDPSGRVQLPALVAGVPHTLSLRPPLPGESHWQRARIEKWLPEDLTVKLEPGCFVSGVVRDMEGRPVAGASVGAVIGGGIPFSTTTGPSGRFRLHGLAPGPVMIRAAARHAEMYGRSPAEATVEAGTKDIVLVLDRGRALVLRFKTLTGNDRIEATFQVEGVGTFTGELDGLGHVRFKSLPTGSSGTARVLRKSDHWSWFGEGLVAGADLEVSLLPPRTISGRVLLPDGFQWSRAQVALPWRWNSRVDLERDGTFVLTKVPAWPCTVSVWLEGKGETLRGRVESVGGSTVEIDMRK